MFLKGLWPKIFFSRRSQHDCIREFIGLRHPTSSHLRGRPGLSSAVAAEVGLEAVSAVVTLQHAHQVADVGGRQPQRLDFAELRVRGNVGNAVPQVRERVVDTLRPPGNNTGILYKVVSAVLIGELKTITYKR